MFGHTAAGVVMSTAATAALIGDGFYNVGVVAKAAVDATSQEKDCKCKN